MIRSFKSRALILSSTPRGEKDRLVESFTEEQGRIAAVAYGVRKPGSRFGSLLEPGMLIHAIFSRGRAGFPSIGECSLVHSFSAGLTGFEEFQSLLELLRLLRQGTRDEYQDRELFAHSLQILELFHNRVLSPAVVQLLAAVLLLEHGGMLPDWSGCGSCHGIKEVMVLTRHGLYCSGCNPDEKMLFELSGGEVRVLGLLASRRYDTIATLNLTDQRLSRLVNVLEILNRHAQLGT